MSTAYSKATDKRNGEMLLFDLPPPWLVTVFSPTEVRMYVMSMSIYVCIKTHTKSIFTILLFQ